MAITHEELEWLEYCRQRQQEFFPRLPRETVKAVIPRPTDEHLERLAMGEIPGAEYRRQTVKRRPTAR